MSTAARSCCSCSALFCSEEEDDDDGDALPVGEASEEEADAIMLLCFIG